MGRRRQFQVDGPVRWPSLPMLVILRRNWLRLAPDVIVVTGTAGLAPMMQVAPTVPIVFVNVADPVGAGFVDSMSRPGGNITGFVQFEYSLSAKWLELLNRSLQNWRG